MPGAEETPTQMSLEKNQTAFEGISGTFLAYKHTHTYIVYSHHNIQWGPKQLCASSIIILYELFLLSVAVYVSCFKSVTREGT